MATAYLAWPEATEALCPGLLTCSLPAFPPAHTCLAATHNSTGGSAHVAMDKAADKMKHGLGGCGLEDVQLKTYAYLQKRI